MCWKEKRSLRKGLAKFAGEWAFQFAKTTTDTSIYRISNGLDVIQVFYESTIGVRTMSVALSRWRIQKYLEKNIRNHPISK